MEGTLNSDVVDGRDVVNWKGWEGMDVVDGRDVVNWKGTDVVDGRDVGFGRC